MCLFLRVFTGVFRISASKVEQCPIVEPKLQATMRTRVLGAVKIVCFVVRVSHSPFKCPRCSAAVEQVIDGRTGAGDGVEGQNVG